MKEQQPSTPSHRMDLFKIMLVFVCLSNCPLMIESNLDADRPQPASSVATTEFDSQPLIVHYSFDASKPAIETMPKDNIRSSSARHISSTQSIQDATQQLKTNPTTTAATTSSTTTTTTAATTTTTTTTTTATTATTTNANTTSTAASPTTISTSFPNPITTTISQHQMPSFAPQPHCTLGDDNFQIGERWNPNLPPFGVQVCVLCECTIRPRKNCYEPKVTCRRVINECPVIDSCPDGKKPVTVAGQCCKSCQSTSPTPQQESNAQVQQQQPQTLGNQSPAYESQTSQGEQQQTPFKIVYMNERTKEYMSMVKNLPACPIKDSETRSASSSAPTSPTPSLPLASKAPKGSRNDLNGIDTRLAFKSLHDSASNYLMPSKSRQEESSRRLDHSPSEDHHQHPNDVQSASSSNNNNNNNNNFNHQSFYGRTKQYNNSPDSPHQPSSHNCILGNDTFQVGDVWNPILPPFGIQVCVQCNCIFRIRKGCYETKVTCRRVNKDCPVLDSCPDGKPPVTVSGQCCKSCPTLINNVEQQPINLMNGGSTTISPFLTLDGVQRNEKVFREFHAVSRNLNVCIRTRESVDIYNTSRYARRSQRAR